MTDIKRFDVTEHLRAKVRETLIGSLPDEQMDAMIQAEFRAYFEPEQNRYNSTTTPSPFQSLVRETISKEVESSLRRWIDAYFETYWAEHGETALQDLVSGFVANAHKVTMENMIKHALSQLGYSVWVNR